MTMPESVQVKVPREAYDRLKRIARSRGVTMTSVLAEYISKLEANKVKTEPDVVECGECGEVIPPDALFCPYCGVEFEIEEEPEEDEESEDDDEEDEEE